jgi:hypothetical protein
MKRLWLGLVLALAVTAAIPATAAADHTLAHKVSKLAKKVNRLQSEVDCLRRNGAATYLGYPYYEGLFAGDPPPWDIHAQSSGIEDTDFAANFVHAAGGPADYWLLALRNTSNCRDKFSVVANPYVSPLPRTADMRARQLSRVIR